jgi:hypothetical protein
MLGPPIQREIDVPHRILRAYWYAHRYNNNTGQHRKPSGTCGRVSVLCAPPPKLKEHEGGGDIHADHSESPQTAAPNSLVMWFSGAVMNKLADISFDTWTNGSSRVRRRPLHEGAVFQLEKHVNFS